MVSDGKKYPEVKVFEIKVLHFKKFLGKIYFKSLQYRWKKIKKIQKNFKYPIYPRVSKIFSDRRFINIDHSRMEEFIALVFISKTTYHSFLIHSEDKLIHFYFNNYKNQEVILF